ncbi:hypothetical protein PEC18_32960 [Paucibacter sp. O1-1]|uniref:hypothetical protein n=1 Tax=unclassified Roseateles TaxID=2626991 RepID=UPI001484D824|nr:MULTISPECIES: hypothetical protein [unclassified Roseateles]MCU7375506.1 hypothetical protein [Paucibacter sp. O1-1]MCZ7884700.1 hypothetical protein [Paucibacter sp. M5-1]MDA3830513.1 hypothetical protein [Paucibacter sp. O1-1]MDC6171234.1 hypothetical protein [Paucibacter sp. XJ19-41]
METLKLDAPLSTREPEVLLDPRLPVGAYIVRLVIEGPSGKSAPATLLLRVQRG